MSMAMAKDAYAPRGGAFGRCSWAAHGREERWGPRFERVRAALQHIRWLSVTEGFSTCTTAVFTLQQLEKYSVDWVNAGLNWYIFHADSSPEGATVQVVIGADGHLRSFANLLGERPGELLIMLGWPECCVVRYLAQLEAGSAYSPWDLFATTIRPQENRIIAEQPSPLNPLWRPLDIQCVFHVPCSLDCESSLAIARRTLDTGRRHGYQDEMEWLEQILAWPMEWSALHGVGEGFTPVMRLMHDCPSAHIKQSVRYGLGRPQDQEVMEDAE